MFSKEFLTFNDLNALIVETIIFRGSQFSWFLWVPLQANKFWTCLYSLLQTNSWYICPNECFVIQLTSGHFSKSLVPSIWLFEIALIVSITSNIERIRWANWLRLPIESKFNHLISFVYCTITDNNIIRRWQDFVEFCCFNF